MLTINFNPFPNLETERLLLRRVDSNDIKEIFALRSNPEDEVHTKAFGKTDEEALAHIAMIDGKIDSNEGINWGLR
jgi:ribosomal-protein-alanine N-acetyltransferase